MISQGPDFTTTGATTSYTTQQYQYNYQYQMPTTTQTTTTTTQYTTEPVTTTYTTQQYSIPEYTQSYTTVSGVPTVSVPGVVTTSVPGVVTTSVPGVVTTSVPGVVPGPMRPQPAFRLLRQGSGISPNEQQGIVSTAMLVYQYGITPISNNTASRIKKTLGGDWIVIVYPEGKPIDFNMTCVQGNDYMYFTLDNMAYQVCRLR